MTIKQMILDLESINAKSSTHDASPKLPFNLHQSICDLLDGHGDLTDVIAILEAIDEEDE
jgi:hypothetical protein